MKFPPRSTLLRLTLWMIPLIAGAAIFVFSIQNAKQVILPGTAYEGSLFDDGADDGNSVIREIENDSSGIKVTMRLKEGFIHPYAGVIFHLGSDSQFLDLSAYDYLSMTIKGSTPLELSIHLRSYVEKFTSPDDIMTYRFLVKEIHSTDSIRFFRLPLHSFSTPQWWYSRHRVESDSFPRESFNQVTDLVIQSATSTPLNQTIELELDYIGFEKDVPGRLIWWLSLTGSYLLLSFVGMNVLGIRRKKPAIPVVSYEQLQVESYTDEDAKRIVSFIARSYSSPDLDITRVGREVGLSPAKVSSVFKTALSVSFRQYLNTIRLTEAKRLLRSTDRQVADIAGKVGYNSVVHFNRIFKATEGITPNQYRKNAN
ncbi:MAG: helix-turn-helix transcriptional regulator [Chitinivibrionales bacterium]